MGIQKVLIQRGKKLQLMDECLIIWHTSVIYLYLTAKIRAHIFHLQYKAKNTT